MRLTVNVAGHPFDVEADPTKNLWRVMNQAFGAAGLIGEPWENWELRDGDGRLLHKEAEVSAFDFTPSTVLFLNRKAAIGG